MISLLQGTGGHHAALSEAGSATPQGNAGIPDGYDARQRLDRGLGNFGSVRLNDGGTHGVFVPEGGDRVGIGWRPASLPTLGLTT